ncbi:unnamed protein product [Closterium sp. NIES-54]
MRPSVPTFAAAYGICIPADVQTTTTSSCMNSSLHPFCQRSPLSLPSHLQPLPTAQWSLTAQQPAVARAGAEATCPPPHPSATLPVRHPARPPPRPSATPPVRHPPVRHPPVRHPLICRAQIRACVILIPAKANRLCNQCPPPTRPRIVAQHFNVQTTHRAAATGGCPSRADTSDTRAPCPSSNAPALRLSTARPSALAPIRREPIRAMRPPAPCAHPRRAPICAVRPSALAPIRPFPPRVLPPPRLCLSQQTRAVAAHTLPRSYTPVQARQTPSHRTHVHHTPQCTHPRPRTVVAV